MYDNILSYDLFVFDFDGTILDTEPYHCKAWNIALNEYNISTSITDIDINVSLNEYFQYFHSLDNKYTKMYLHFKYKINIDQFDIIYLNKQKIYNELIKKNKVLWINECNNFLQFIIENNKEFIIVTNTSKDNINIFKEQYPILNKALCFYTKEGFFCKKPNPECYLKIVHNYKNKIINNKLIQKIIGFEDSLPGFHALYQVTDITPVFIHAHIYTHNKYYHYDTIMNEYPNLIEINNYHLDNLNNKLNYSSFNLDNLNIIDTILDHNINELNKNKESMKYIIHSISTILKNKNTYNHIYLSGMGKSGYICKKCASTWQSLSIKSSYIDLPNLPHGDFGIFNDNDILLLISNGGNTKEVIDILKYIKYNLKTKINIISIVANENSEMSKYSNITYVLNNIIEADLINMTPSTSSIIFMSLLDAIAINIRKDITKDEFKMYHPSGSLGKR